MQVQGSPSWRFAESDAQLAHEILFVRDAVGLVVPADTGLPPALEGTPPDLRYVVDEAPRRDAGGQWTEWWNAVVAHEIADQAGPGASGHRALPRARMVSREDVGVPPDYAALADRPALREAALATRNETRAWMAAGPHRSASERRGGHFEWTLVRDVARDVAFDHSVRIDAVRGVALVLAVTGRWWHRVGPGAVLASASAAADPTTAHVVLRDVFESGLPPARP